MARKTTTPQFHGLLNVHKEAGFTSNDAVVKLRGILGQRKIGHTGTLDPDATGVLVVCLGTGTKLVDLITDHDKEYIAQVRLGVTTDTLDLSGKVLSMNEADVTLEDVKEALQAFQGDIEQVPPMYSAIKVGGKKLYELAREGKEVERKPRTVHIDAISLLDATDFAKTHTFTMEVRCSKGTYIRSLCADIGERLSCGASMAHLTRTAVGGFRLEEALTLTQIEAARDDGTLQDFIKPVDFIFRDLDAVTVKEDAVRLVDNGNAFRVRDIAADDIAASASKQEKKEDADDYRDKERVRVYRPDDSFVGIYRYDARVKQFRVEKMLG